MELMAGWENKNRECTCSLDSWNHAKTVGSSKCVTVKIGTRKYRMPWFMHDQLAGHQGSLVTLEMLEMLDWRPVRSHPLR